MKRETFITILLLFNLYCEVKSQSLIQNLFVEDPRRYKLEGSVKKLEEHEYYVEELLGDEILIEDTLACPTILEFSFKGQLIKSEYCISDLYNEYTFQYDKKNNNIYEISPHDRNENTFDNFNNLIEHKISVTDSSYFGKWIYKYDKNKNQTERIGYIGNDFIERWKHIYDKNNYRTEELMIDENSDSTIYIQRLFSYDSIGNIIKQIYKSLESSPGQCEDYFKYDSLNNIIEWKRIDFDGRIEIELYNYKYDENRNWIEKAVCQDNVLIKVYKRKITYWK